MTTSKGLIRRRRGRRRERRGVTKERHQVKVKVSYNENKIVKIGDLG